MERKFLYVFADNAHIDGRQMRCLLCPFCEVSTCDVVANIFKVNVYFCCYSCNALAFARPLIREATREAIQKVYPNVDIDTSVKTLWKTEFYFVSGVTSSILSLYDGYNMGPEDIVNFSKEVYDYAKKKNIDVVSVYRSNDFLPNSQLARKHKIVKAYDSDKLHIPVNSFDVTRPEIAYPKNMKFYCENIYFLIADGAITWLASKMNT